MSRMPFRVAIVVLVALTLFFAWDLSQRVVTNLRLTQMERQLESDVANARATRTALEEKKKEVQSPAYAESEMRGYGWVREGETLVVTLKTPATLPIVSHASPTPTPTPAKSAWQDLFDWLFGP